MTDARLPERWLNDRRILRLSDAGYRLHVTGLLWCVANRTDGALADEDLPLLPRSSVSAVDELEQAGLWQRAAGGWLLVDFAATQTSSHELAVLENVRQRERVKKARQRQRAKEAPDVPGDSPAGTSPGTAQDRTGQAGQARPRRKEQEQQTCPTCTEPMSPDVVAAGWTTHPVCTWPPVRAVNQ